MDEENQQSPDLEKPPALPFSSPLPGHASTHRKSNSQCSQDLEATAEIDPPSSLTEVDLGIAGQEQNSAKQIESIKQGNKQDDLESSLTEADLLTLPTCSHNNAPHHQKRMSSRHLRFSFITENHRRIRQESTANMFGGFGEMNQTVKLYQKIGAAVKDGKYETLDKLYMGSSEVAFMEESRIKFQAREKSIRHTTGFTLFLFLCYFLVSVPILVHVGGVEFQDALLYCVYSMTSTGFGSVKVPLTSSAFLVFLMFVMFFGIACVMLLAATLYLYISLQASKIKKNLDKARLARQDEDTDIKCLGERRHPGKCISALRSCASFVEDNVRKSECVRLAVIGGYLLILSVGGAIAMMFFEGWTFIQAWYFANYCMTTMGYGDVTPDTRGGIWFVIFWLPLNVTFISFYMGNLARYFMIFGSANARRVYKREIAALKKVQQSVDEVWDLVGVGESRHSKTMEETSVQSMQVIVELVLENFLHEDDKSHSATLRKLLDLQSPWTATGPFHANKVRKPSFALQVLMQERLMTIVAEEVAGMFTNFFEKDATFVVAIEPLQAVAEKWKIPAGAREAFALVAFEATVYVGEKRLVLQGTKALLKLTPFECQTLFSPLLAAFEDAGTMEGWLATTEEIATSYSSVKAFESTEIEGKLALCDNEQDIVALAGLKKECDRSMEETQAMNLSRYQANRTLAWVILIFFLVYQTLVTVYVIHRADLTVSQGLLYTVYTMTSAGFGSVKVPTTDGFLLVAIFNMFMSVSIFAIVIAQTLLYLQGVVVRREHARDKISFASSGQTALASLISDTNQGSRRARDVMRTELAKALRVIPGSTQKNHGTTKKELVFHFLLDTERGRVICVACTLLTLWFMGAIATMVTEDWSIFEGLYFATYALLTVGHGDLVPKTEAGTWFCVVWLPFNILFVSLYLGSVAHLFVVLSNKYTTRIEQQIRRDAELRKEEREEEQPSGGTTEPEPQEELNTVRKDKIQRRLSIKQTSQIHTFNSNGAEIVHARDLLSNLQQWQPTRDPSDPTRSVTEPSLRFLAASAGDGSSGDLASRYHTLLKNAINDEGFTLRLDVLDRVARIISAQLLNDFESGLEVDGSNLRVSLNSLKDWITEWKIPQRARRTYRVMTFECLLFVGEKQLFDSGFGAFLSLSTIEFIELFSPFVFALKHKEAMEEWLASTHDLANKRLPLGFDDQGQLEDDALASPRGRFFVKNTIENYFPVNPGNVIRMQLQNY